MPKDDATFGVLIHDEKDESYGRNTDCLIMALNDTGDNSTDIVIKANCSNSMLAITIANLQSDLDKFLATRPEIAILVASLRAFKQLVGDNNDTQSEDD